MVIWSDPYTWKPGDLINATILNTQIRWNQSWLSQDNMPIRAYLFHDASKVEVGNGITTAILTTQPHNFVCYQNPAADGDQFTQTVYLYAGSFYLKILGQTRNDAGMIDWTFDEDLIALQQDWYSAVNTANVVKTATDVIETAAHGLHTITGTVNDKNVASSGYQIRITKMYVIPVNEDY